MLASVRVCGRMEISVRGYVHPHIRSTGLYARASTHMERKPANCGSVRAKESQCARDVKTHSGAGRASARKYGGMREKGGQCARAYSCPLHAHAYTSRARVGNRGSMREYGG